MSCNFLVKFDGERTYEHLIIRGCSGSSPTMAAIRHFVNNNQKLTAKSFDPNTFEGIRRIWVVYLVGVATFEECYEILTGPIQIIKDPNKPRTEENMLHGIGWRAEKVAEKDPVLIPGMERYCRAVSCLENKSVSESLGTEQE